MKAISLLCAALLPLLPIMSHAQVNSGSNGSDGALNPTANLVIDMADHPDGIYHYTSVNIPAGVTLSFIPNAGNKPVVWLVQGDCVIDGTVDVSGKNAGDGAGGSGGPGGWKGGNSSNNPSSGQGPGGGEIGAFGGNASFGNTGAKINYQSTPGAIYGNNFLIPLFGGSGGGGGWDNPPNLPGGGGGGGAILISTSGIATINGSLTAGGGSGCAGGSGGAIRLVAAKVGGNGGINTFGGRATVFYNVSEAGSGRVRFDSLQNDFAGVIRGNFSQGFQPIIIPAAGQGIQLSIASIAGNAVSANPSGVLVNPDVIIPAQQTNPISIVVNCNNIPLNSEISVIVRPANGSEVQAVGINNAGTLGASTATVSLNMPRGGGIIYAKCVSGLAGLGADNSTKELRTKSLAETGWTTEGERFAKVEVTASLGGQQQIAYITESGKRYSLASR